MDRTLSLVGLDCLGCCGFVVMVADGVGVAVCCYGGCCDLVAMIVNGGIVMIIAVEGGSVLMYCS